jgi:SAM-dependent methyltransferase
VAELRMSITIDRCPTCGSTRLRPFQEVTKHGGIRLTYRVCVCGLVFMSPRANEEEINAFYAQGYRTLYCGTEEPTEHNLEEQAARAQHLADLARSIGGPFRSHLDIGCSTGSLLEAIAAERPVGVEPTEAHRRVAEGKGLTVYRTLDEALGHREHYDLVSMSHVLEHLPNPVQTLQQLRPATRLLLVEVPNLLGHGSYGVGHLFCFYRKTLLDALLAAGFRSDLVKMHSFPRGDNGHRYIAAVARPAPTATVHRSAVPMLKLRRWKGLSRRSWAELALRAPAYAARRIRR